jgi:hypothetical protein
MKVSTTSIAYCIVKSIGSGGAVRHRIIRAFGPGSATTTYFNFTITNDYYTSLAIDNGQFLYLAGYRPSAVTGTGKLISTACISTGSSPFLKWSSIDNCGTVAGDDVARQIVVGPDGFLYMVGYSTGNVQHGIDAFTFKLAPSTGKKVWENFINNTLTDGAFLVNVPDISTVNVGWTSGSVAFVEQINTSTGLSTRRVSYAPTPLSPYTSIGQTTITGMVTSTIGKNVYLTGTITANNAGQSFEAAWLVKFNFSSRSSTPRIENAASVEGSYTQSKRASGLALSNSNTNVYWVRDLAENQANHLQEKVEISSLEGTGTFRFGTEMHSEHSKDRIAFANPVSNVLQISSVDQMNRIQVLDITGKILLESTQTSNYQILEAQQLPAGVYHVVVVHNDGFTTIKPFVKH